MMVSNKRGFTLIELLVVVLIIGILAAIALPQYEKAVEKSRLSEVLLNIATIKRGVDIYIMENGWFTNDGNLEEIGGTGVLGLNDILTAAGAELSGGEWKNNQYTTKNFDYRGNCSQSDCEITICRMISGVNRYELALGRHSSGWYPDACYTQDTDLGRGICKQLATQGWDYVDEEY